MHTDDNGFENETNNDFIVDNDVDVDENFYGYENSSNYNNDSNLNNNSGKSKKVIIIVIVAIILLVCIGGLIFFLVRNNGNGSEQPVLIPSVTLLDTNFELAVGSSKKITYTVENYSDDIAISWSSSDKSIATVSSDGTVKGVKVGTVTITATYIVDGVEYQKNCSVTIKKKDSSSGNGSSGTTTPVKDTTDPKLSYTITTGKKNAWVNKDVTIKVTASDNSGSVTVKYTTNCNSSCKYTTVSGGVIKVSTEGSSVVRIVASDKAGNSTEEKVTVMIDKKKPTCSLTVSETGTLTAKYNDTGDSGIAYYGFASSYSGDSKNSQTLSKGGTYTYYVKDKAGNTSTCSLEVKTETKYRYQDCIGCNRCESAGCETYYPEYETTYTLNSDKYYDAGASLPGTKRYKERVISCEAKGATGSGYTCYTKRTYCAIFKRSCYVCKNSEGSYCDTWGEFSAWSNTEYTKTNTRNVETKTVYKKK